METTSNPNTTTNWTKQAAGRYTTVVPTREGDPDIEIVIEQNWDGGFRNMTRTEWLMHTETGFHSEYDFEPFATLAAAKHEAELAFGLGVK
jgi:hypothetical protein